jgi:hypothetical protein
VLKPVGYFGSGARMGACATIHIHLVRIARTGIARTGDKMGAINLLTRALQIIQDAEGYKTFTSELDAPEVIQEINVFLASKSGQGRANGQEVR